MTDVLFTRLSRTQRGDGRSSLSLLAVSICVLIAALAAAHTAPAAEGAASEASAAVTIENDHLRFVIGRDGRTLQFVDKRTGKEHCAGRGNRSFARVTIGTREHRAAAARRKGDRIVVRFEGTDAEAVVKATSHEDYLVFEVVDVSGTGVDRLTLLDVTLAEKAGAEDDFAACVLALNLKTNVPEIPQPSSHLRAMCYARFGLSGARVAVIGCPLNEMRGVMKRVVRDTPELPQSDVGGPWALEAPINRGSYLFNFGGLSEETAADWIALAQQLGVSQIDFHGGQSFRFGDCRPNPKTYPNGLASLKAAVDRLHAAGISAGFHTYAFFLDKQSRWVTRT
jgi:cytochrome c1